MLVDVLLCIIILLLVIDLPEPLVDLILLHVELLSQLDAQLSWRHLAHVIFIDGPEYVHLLWLLSIALHAWLTTAVEANFVFLRRSLD